MKDLQNSHPDVILNAQLRHPEGRRPEGSPIPPRSDMRIEVPLGHRSESAHIRLAIPVDAPQIRALYQEIYHGKYTLSIIYDSHETEEALHKENYFWFVTEFDQKIVGSVIFCIDPNIKLSKVFGAVIHPDFRGYNLTQQAMALGIQHLIVKSGLANSVYATARTVLGASQKLTKNLGFKELGIFPNVRKVANYETHCLTAYFKEGSLRQRKPKNPRLPLLLKPFYDIVQQTVGIDDAEWHDLPVSPSSPYRGDWISFEMIEAENFILTRWNELKSQRKLDMEFFPFHEPNLLLISQDQTAEIYLHHSRLDHHAVIIGGFSNGYDLTHLLNSLVIFLEEKGVRYLELIIDAYHPRVIKQIMDARFIPSAYYPAMRWKNNKGRDYIVFSKSFVLLDFKNIAVQPPFNDYLKEYYNLWRNLYIDGAFSEPG